MPICRILSLENKKINQTQNNSASFHPYRINLLLLEFSIYEITFDAGNSVSRVPACVLLMSRQFGAGLENL